MFTLNCKGRLLVLDTPVVMGIINCTPDSFFEGSRHESVAGITATAASMLAAGATIIDLGGQSTRPGSEHVDAATEQSRVVPAIQEIRRQFPGCFISIDTFYAAVAREAVAAGADLVNDVSAGLMDPEMIPTVASLGVPYVAMHMQGTPQTMQTSPQYEDVTREVVAFFLQHTYRLQQAGIRDVIIDPGFGFGKTIQHNFQLLRNLEALSILPYPLLVGLSRKSTIYKTLGITADEALNGTTVLHTISLLKGAHILRAHDVKEAMECIRLVQALQKA